LYRSLPIHAINGGRNQKWTQSTSRSKIQRSRKVSADRRTGAGIGPRTVVRQICSVRQSQIQEKYNATKKRIVTVLALAAAVIAAMIVYQPRMQAASAAGPKVHGWRKADAAHRLPEMGVTGAPLTPNGLNNGKAGFPEYHHVYIEDKNLAAYQKTGSFPEGTVVVKEVTLLRARRDRAALRVTLGFLDAEVARAGRAGVNYRGGSIRALDH
jgi:hypothetical protein